MVQFYKPNKKVTGTACSFWMNRDQTFMASMIKQDGWNDKTGTGSFAKNKDNPNKRVVVKLGNEEVAGIINVLETNTEWSTYHRSPKQELQIKFCPYLRDGKQIGYSFSVSKQDSGDSTNRVGFIIGFSYPEGRYLKEYLLFLLQGWFKLDEAKQLERIREDRKKMKVVEPSGGKGVGQDLDVDPEEEVKSSGTPSRENEDFEW